MNVAIPARSLFGHVWPSVVLFNGKQHWQAPSSFIHIGEKFLQMASTNCTDAGHLNTHPVD